MTEKEIRHHIVAHTSLDPNKALEYLKGCEVGIEEDLLEGTTYKLYNTRDFHNFISSEYDKIDRISDEYNKK